MSRNISKFCVAKQYDATVAVDGHGDEKCKPNIFSESRLRYVVDALPIHVDVNPGITLPSKVSNFLLEITSCSCKRS